MLRGAALAYARRGVPVFPCAPGGKRPLTRNGFWDATTEARRIEAWWGRWPAANVGVPTGRRSGLLVLDADPRDGGFESLALLERENGPPPETARARTGGGGVHVFFGYPAGETVRNSAGVLGTGLDARRGGIRGGAAEQDPKRLRVDRQVAPRRAGVAPRAAEGARRRGDAVLRRRGSGW